jgi:hypothetical protein
MAEKKVKEPRPLTLNGDTFVTDSFKAEKAIKAYEERIAEAIFHIASDPDYLSKLASEISADSNLDKTQVDELIIKVTLKNQEFTGEGAKEGGAYRPESLFPKYSFFDDDADLPCGLIETNRDAHDRYAHWLRDVFLPTFHPLPRGDLQYPVIACLMLMNAMAGKKTTKFPHPWLQGLSGCGKTHLMESFGYHYPEQLIIRTQPDITGAGLRDEIDAKVGQGEPGILLFDNFWCSLSLEKLGSQRSIILANDRLHAISTLSTKGDNNQRNFRTHCIKVFSTVDDGRQGATLNGMGEITRRLWVITCKDTGAKPPTREQFSWKGMQQGFDELWGHSAKYALENDYANAFRAVSRLKQDKIPFDAKIWEILIAPLAVWQYAGLGTLEEGIDAFLKHRQWTYEINTAQTDVLLQAVQDFMKKQSGAGNWTPKPWHSEEEQRADREQYMAKAKQVIAPDDIKRHVESLLPMIIVNQNVMTKEIVPIMNTCGYTWQVTGNSAMFVKL